MHKLLLFFSFLTNVISPPPPNTGPVAKEGEFCGGMIPLEMKHTCDKLHECVYTKGPMVADAPGVCKPKCSTKRDSWGNCIPENCDVWNDGCNSCQFNKNTLTKCTDEVCYDAKHEAKCERYSTDPTNYLQCGNVYNHLTRMNDVCCANEKDGNCLTGFPKTCSPECSSIISVLFKDCDGLIELTGVDKQPGWIEFEGKCKKTNGHATTKIPVDCATWYDGCNRCTVKTGKVYMCTKRECLRIGAPRCMARTNANGRNREFGRQCFDGKDNDGDGKADCDDSDCRFYGHCRHKGGKETGKMCFDGKDNDKDGSIDCDDSDCKKDPRASRHCRHTETGKECFDGKDNDHDHKIDCADSDCQKDPRAAQICQSKTEGPGLPGGRGGGPDLPGSGGGGTVMLRGTGAANTH